MQYTHAYFRRGWESRYRSAFGLRFFRRKRTGVTDGLQPEGLAQIVALVLPHIEIGFDMVDMMDHLMAGGA